MTNGCPRQRRITLSNVAIQREQICTWYCDTIWQRARDLPRLNTEKANNRRRGRASRAIELDEFPRDNASFSVSTWGFPARGRGRSSRIVKYIAVDAVFIATLRQTVWNAETGPWLEIDSAPLSRRRALKPWQMSPPTPRTSDRVHITLGRRFRDANKFRLFTIGLDET